MSTASSGRTSTFRVLTDDGEQQATKFFVNGVEHDAPRSRPRTATHPGHAHSTASRSSIRRPASGSGSASPRSHGDDRPARDERDWPASRARSELPPLGEVHWTADSAPACRATMTPELAEFVGYFMGDGSLHAKGLRFCVANARTPMCVDQLSGSIKDLFNLDADGRRAAGVHRGRRVNSVAARPVVGGVRLRQAARRIDGHTRQGLHAAHPRRRPASNDRAVYRGVPARRRSRPTAP